MTRFETILCEVEQGVARITLNRPERQHTGHPDLAEGTRAFVEKRKPRWAPCAE